MIQTVLMMAAAIRPRREGCQKCTETAKRTNADHTTVLALKSSKQLFTAATAARPVPPGNAAAAPPRRCCGRGQ